MTFARNARLIFFLFGMHAMFSFLLNVFTDLVVPLPLSLILKLQMLIFPCQ